MAAFANAQTTVDAVRFIDRSLAGCGIQKAIDSLPPEGGVVQLPEGRFSLERYLFLKSGVTLKGKGAETVLSVGKPETRRYVAADVKGGSTEIALKGDLAGLKPGAIVHAWRFRNPSWLGYIKPYMVKSIEGQTISLHTPSKYPLLLRNKAQVSWGMTTRLAADAVKGGTTIRIEHPDLLEPGYAIHFQGKGDMWDQHFNVVTAIDGDTCTLERSLTVSAGKGELVQHAHCAITADGQSNIGVEDLDIEGWKGEEKPCWGGFTLGGIHFVRCSDIAVRNVNVRWWNGDAFSVQSGKNARVENCSAVECRGRGFHPGTNFENGEFVNLKSLRNAGDGFYYCWHNRNVNLRNSRLQDNGGNGVGGLGNPGDRRCIVEGNTITGNACAGIGVNGGILSGTVIRNNIVRDNSRSNPGAYAGIAIYASAEDAKQYTIEGNTVESTLENPTQWVGIEERNGKPLRRERMRKGKTQIVTKLADENVIRNNKVSGHKKADILIIGPKTVCENNGEAKVVRGPAPEFDTIAGQ